MAPYNAQRVLWKPADREKPEPAQYCDGIVYITRGEFDLSFRLDPTDKLIPIGNSTPPICM